MNQKGFALNYLIIGLVISALIGGAYYFGKTTNKPIISTQQQITPTPSVDETANWKTYTSPEVNYSFKYPSDWIYQGKSEGCGPVFRMPDTNNQIWLTVCGPYINPDETPEEIAKRSIGKNDILINKENIIVNGHQAIKQEKKAVDGKFNLEIFVGDVSFKNGSKGTLGIYFYIMDSSKEKEARQVFNQILPTFKFIDQNQLSVTPTVTIQMQNFSKPVSWRTVDIKDRNISLCLPAQWEWVSDNGWEHLVFNRDANYRPDVAGINILNYAGGSRREEYINFKIKNELDKEKLKNQTTVKELSINGTSVLDIQIPSFPEAIVFVQNGQLYEISLGQWNLINNSKDAFMKDIYTMISCVKLL